MADRVLPSSGRAASMTTTNLSTNEYGFNWRPKGAKSWTRVHRMWTHQGRAVLRIDSGDPDAASTIDIYVSSGGRSIRVFRGGKELV